MTKPKAALRPFKPTYNDPSPPDKVPPAVGSDVAIYVDPGAFKGERMGYLWQRAKVLKTFTTGGLYVEWKDRRTGFPRKLTVRATRWRYIEKQTLAPCTTISSSSSSLLSSTPPSPS